MTFKNLFNGYFVPLSILIPIGICLINYKDAKKPAKFLFFYLVISGLINLAALILIRYKLRNLPLLHLYTIVETVFLLGYFRSIFEEPKIKKIIAYIMICFPILCILNFVFLQSIYTFNTHTRPLEAIIVTFFCLLYFYKIGFAENWLQKPVYWFNAGILLYFPAAIIIFISSNYLISEGNKAMNSIVWSVHNGLVLIMYLVWAKGFSLMKNGR